MRGSIHHRFLKSVKILRYYPVSPSMHTVFLQSILQQSWESSKSHSSNDLASARADCTGFSDHGCSSIMSYANKKAYISFYFAL